jgi:hypothetical protein
VKEGSEGGREGGGGKKEGNIPVSFAYEVRFKGKQGRNALFQDPLHTKLGLRKN